MTISALESSIERAHLTACTLRNLDQYGLQRTSTGYYYIAHYPPLRAMTSTQPDDARRMLQSVEIPVFELYFHFPFCDVKCTFCHFYKEVDSERSYSDQAAYIQAMLAELRLHVSIFGRLHARSLYIGGGTPSTMDHRALRALLAGIRDSVIVLPDAELKFELFPGDYEPAVLNEKLNILRDFGFTDVVIDLESGNDKALAFVGRRTTSMSAYLKLVECCVAHGFTSVVTGLIIGLPHETFESLASTIDTLLSLPSVSIVNTFPLIVRQPDAIYTHFTRHSELFPDAAERDAMWIFARDRFMSAGFSEGPISYLRRGTKRPHQQADKFECVNLLGFGASAFGFLNAEDHAFQYFNYCTRSEYYNRVERGHFATWRAGRLEQAERARRKLIFGLANCKTESLLEIERRFHVSVDHLVGRELNALLALNLIELDMPNAGIRYTPTGLARLEEISYFLGSEHVKNRSSAALPASCEFRLQLLQHHYYIDVSPSDRTTFEEFAASHEQGFMHRLAEVADVNAA